MASGALGRRLARLEGQAAFAGRNGPCPECLHQEGAIVQWVCPVPRVIGEPDDPDDDPSKDICSTCGRKRVWRVASPRPLEPLP